MYLPCQASIIDGNDFFILEDIVSMHSHNHNGVTKYTYFVNYIGEILAVAKDADVLSTLRPFEMGEVVENPPECLHFGRQSQTRCDEFSCRGQDACDLFI